MTTFSKANIVGAIALSLFLAAPGVAFAGKGGGGPNGGNNGPKESVSLNYGKTQTTYTSQKTGSKKGEGRASFHDLSFIHRIDKASP
jgi:type VI protein secretion system component Hcp